VATAIVEIYRGNDNISGKKRLASINTPAVMIIQTVAKTGADDKKSFNVFLLIRHFLGVSDFFIKSGDLRHSQ
jgi:hypothetical protein